MSTTDMVENPLQGGNGGRDKLSMEMKAFYRKSKESIRKKGISQEYFKTTCESFEKV